MGRRSRRSNNPILARFFLGSEPLLASVEQAQSRGFRDPCSCFIGDLLIPFATVCILFLTILELYYSVITFRAFS